MQIVFLRHFETEVEEDKPFSEWELSENGEQEMQTLLESDLIDSLDRVYSSPEPKALRTARAVADSASVPLVQLDELREVDRSGEGFIKDDDEYVRMVGEYLRNPAVPFKWENREDVEDRIQRFVTAVETSDERVLVVSHGMFLSLCLPRLSDDDPYTFWRELGFGEIIEADRETLLESIQE